MKPSPAKPKKCKECSTPFIPQRMGQKVCGMACSQQIAYRHREKRVKEMVNAERKADREKKVAMLTIPQLVKKAKTAFNAYIRTRDEKKPCICCGLPLGSGDVGGAYDCGHYRSTGSAPHLRFNPDNAHAQRKVCNRWGAGRAVDYRTGLIQRIGLARVEALESNNEVHKWTREELIQIEATYKQKLKDLRKLETYDSL